MIYIRFRGRLGNQMFQYAAARLAAERLACPLLIEEPLRAAVDLRTALRMSSAYSLFRLFPDLPRGRLDFALSLARRFFPNATDKFVRNVAPATFTPRHLPGAFRGNEAFDPHYFEIGKGTRLVGFFQSIKYFDGAEHRVRDWFSVGRGLAEEAAAGFRTAGINPSTTVAVHVRLGDYRNTRNMVGHVEEGWLIGRDYYRRAFSRLPKDLAVAVFSDEPHCAEDYIGRKADFLGAGQNQYLEFAMMSQCRFLVIANSTFSWWAAWLPLSSDRVVIAPKYFLGWRRQEWFPADIMVPGWEYL